MDGISYKHYIDKQISFVQAEIDRRILETREQATLATATLNQRLAAMNEFRAALIDQAGRMVERAVLDATVESLNKQRDTLGVNIKEYLDRQGDRITKLEEQQYQAKGRQAVYAVIVAIGIGAIGLVGYIINVILQHHGG